MGRKLARSIAPFEAVAKILEPEIEGFDELDMLAHGASEDSLPKRA